MPDDDLAAGLCPSCGDPWRCHGGPRGCTGLNPNWGCGCVALPPGDDDEPTE